MSVLFHAPIELTYELLPLIKTVKGRVVCVSSIAGLVALPGNAPYSAAKHALEAYCDSLRIEMRPWGVKVVLVEPSAMKTPMVEAAAADLKRTYRDARPDRQEQYGEEWLEVNYQKRKAVSTSSMIEDPNIVVRDLMDALLLSNPPSRILSGRVARFLFKPISMLPCSIRDGVLYHALMGGTPKALLQKDTAAMKKKNDPDAKNTR
uniref:Uncharacterized protein n=1 Tax=Grammatophora oceanica TaxID=210454 RepID=A0A7S1UYH3_9STRA|mmetsp:Transcript_29793/g.43935  ORF Transcript_29793/g.43935 Transcript_29793/m.43935 type:complete len:206 (+) Transcript_29793:697-1314(+)